MAEVEADAIFAAGDLGGVGAAADDGADDGGVARRVRRGRQHDAVAEPETGVGGESLVDRDRTGALRGEGNGEERDEQQCAGQRRAEVLQCAVSFSAPRVSASVYDDDP